MPNLIPPEVLARRENVDKRYKHCYRKDSENQAIPVSAWYGFNVSRIQILQRFAMLIISLQIHVTSHKYSFPAAL